MSYLAFDQYQKLGFSLINHDDFAALEQNAEQIFDAQTNAFYKFHDINEDRDTQRVNLFRRALAVQCEFEQQTGIKSAYDLVSTQLTHATFGRTSLETSGSAKQLTYGNTGLAIPAYRLLALTGLLYRGVWSC